MGFFSNKWGVVFAVYLISLSFTSRSIFHKFVSSNLNLSTREIHKNEKCPISRANIVNFDTLTLYQNVSYKMAEQQRFELWLRSPPLTVFKTVPLNRLGTAPARR